MLNEKVDVGIGKEEVLERKRQDEFSYVDSMTRLRIPSQLLVWNGEEDLWVTNPRRALVFACVGEITAAFSGSSTKSKLIALGNPTHAVLDHQHRTLL